MKKNPQSPLAIKMATELILNNRTFTKRQIEDITSTIFACPEDQQRIIAYRRAVATAKAMAVGEPLQNVPLFTQKNRSTSLFMAIPTGKVAFICFWTTWRKPNQKLIPELKNMVAKHPEVVFICVADDKEDYLWQKFLERTQLSWPQYRLTKRGMKQFTDTYGPDATPLFVMLAPDGTIVRASSYLGDMQKLLDKTAAKLAKAYEQQKKKEDGQNEKADSPKPSKKTT